MPISELQLAADRVRKVEENIESLQAELTKHNKIVQEKENAVKRAQLELRAAVRNIEEISDKLKNEQVKRSRELSEIHAIAYSGETAQCARTELRKNLTAPFLGEVNSEYG